MIYARVINNTIYDQAPLSDLYPNTSIPSGGFSQEFLASEGLQELKFTRSYNPLTHKLQRCPAYLEDGVAYAVEVVALTAEELAALDEASRQQNKQTAKQLLANTDWTQLADVQLANKAAFDSYRSELRSIVLNPPITVTWPAEPEAVWS